MEKLKLKYAKIRLRDLATEFLQRVLCRTAKSPLSSEYQPSPRAALGSVCGPQPSGTAHPLHKRERERETGREKKKRMKNTQQHKVIRESWKKTEEEKKLRRHPGVQAHASNTRTRKKKTYGTSDFVTGDNEDAHDESWHEATEDRADETTTSDDEHEE